MTRATSTSSADNPSTYSPQLWAHCPTVLLGRFALSCGVLALAWPRQSGSQRIPERIPCISGVKQMLSAKLSEDAVAAWSTGRCIRKRFTASAWKHSKWNGGHIQIWKRYKRSYLVKVSLHAMFARHEQEIKNYVYLFGQIWLVPVAVAFVVAFWCIPVEFIVKKSKQECHPTVAWLSNQSRGPGWQSYLPQLSSAIRSASGRSFKVLQASRSSSTARTSSCRDNIHEPVENNEPTLSTLIWQMMELKETLKLWCCFKAFQVHVWNLWKVHMRNGTKSQKRC